MSEHEQSLAGAEASLPTAAPSSGQLSSDQVVTALLTMANAMGALAESIAAQAEAIDRLAALAAESGTDDDLDLDATLD